MKVELAVGFAALLAITGCGASHPHAEAPKPIVSTTRLMAADVRVDAETSDAPKVSKPQHAMDGVDEETVDTNDKEPVRKSGRGGGFSGYK